MSKTPILGDGPHPLHWRATWGLYITGSLVALLGVLILLIFVFFSLAGGIDLNAESDIWENGTVAPEAHVREDWTSNENVISSYDLTVDWMDAEGEHHETRYSFSTLSEVDTEQPFEVRYAAADADEGYAIATSWSESVRTSRWGANLCWLFVGLFFAAGSLALGIGTMRRRRRLARAIKGSYELWLPVVSVMGDKSDGGADLIFSLRDEEKDFQFMERFKKGPPLTVGPDEAHVLALRRTDGELVILRHDLYPLKKSEAEYIEIRKRAELPKA